MYKFFVKKKRQRLFVRYRFLVSPERLELSTHWLRVSCSTNWARETAFLIKNYELRIKRALRLCISVLQPYSFIHQFLTEGSVFQKRVQRYCFFFIWPNFRAKKLRESAFFLNFLVYVPFFLYLCRLIVGYSCARAVGSGSTRAKYERNMNGFRSANRRLRGGSYTRLSYVYPTYILRNRRLIVCLSSADFELTLGW